MEEGLGMFLEVLIYGYVCICWFHHFDKTRARDMDLPHPNLSIAWDSIDVQFTWGSELVSGVFCEDGRG